MTYENSPLWHDESIAPAFTPPPLLRQRHDGWTERRQQQFIAALAVTGTVESAARMVGMSRKSAYQLRARADAKSFAEAWDTALSTGRTRMFDAMMDRALNGVTTFTLKLGGAIDIAHGPDGRMMASQSKAPLPGENRFGGQRDAGKGDIR